MIHKIMIYFSKKFRKRRAQKLKHIIDGIYEKGNHGSQNPLTIIDIGGEEPYWNNLGVEYLRSRNVKITLVNIGDVPENEAPDIFSNSFASGCNLSLYDENEFDLAHSNSVIEHVGDWREITKFANEMRRVAPTYYMQTPYFWFPIDPHFYLLPFFHWYPKQIRIWLMRNIGVKAGGRVRDYHRANIAVDSVNLIDATQTRYLYSDGKLSYERILLFLPKSLVIDNYRD